MARLTSKESSELASLERQVEIALEAAAAGSPPAPEALRELLVDSVARLRALESGSDERPDAVESIERALAALDSWRRWRPPSRPTA
jgi:hypothetical protein